MSNARPASLVYANRSNKQHFNSRFEHQERLIDKLNDKVADMEKCFQQLQQVITQTQTIQAKEHMEQISQLKTLINDSNANVEQKLRTTQSTELSGTTANKLAYQLADDVDSVVGLKEAITWKDLWLKRIWAAMLFAGIVLTVWLVCATAIEYLEEPTATKVNMISHASYDYPPILLCPNAWLDALKALSMGLSMEGLKYSLGYIDGWADKARPDNVTRGQTDFIDFYNRTNYTSLDNYFNAISVDVPVVITQVDFFANFNTTAFCDTCNTTMLPRVVIDGMMCYNFQLTPERSRRSRLDPYIGLKVVDRTMGLLESPQWRQYVGANLALRTQTAPRILMQPDTYGSIRITAQSSTSLNTAQSPCESKEDDDNYSFETCVAQCFSPLYVQNQNCTPFELTARNSDHHPHPRELCNVFDYLTSFWALRDSIRKSVSKVLASKEAEQCYKKCPRRCKITVYEARRQQGYTLADFNSEWHSYIDGAKQFNVTLVGLQIENAAIYQGGITTWTEISTISLTSMIGNVGGALGLFVGGTIMTFVQLIMSLVKFALEKRGSKAVIENVEVINTNAA